MKLLIASPDTGGVKTIEIEDDKIRRTKLYEHRMAQEIDGSMIGEAFAGYKFRISGGQDKEGFPMKQGVMAASRVQLLLTPGTTGFCAWRARDGERKRRSVRGCILGPDLASISLVITRKGEKEIEGLTDTNHPRRLAPKRANKIRRLFNLSSEDVRKFVVRRAIPQKEGKKRGYTKAPKIQRLIEPGIIHRREQKKKERRERTKKAHNDRRNFISMTLQRRRDQRLKMQARDTKTERTSFKAEYAKLRKARAEAFKASSAKGSSKSAEGKKKIKK